MSDERETLQQARDEVPPEGNGSAAAIVLLSFALAAIITPIAMWEVEADLFRDHLSVIIAQVAVTAAILVAILGGVYSGFMDRHLFVGIALAGVLLGGGYWLQDWAARAMGSDNPSYIAIAGGGFIGVAGFYAGRWLVRREF